MNGRRIWLTGIFGILGNQRRRIFGSILKSFFRSAFFRLPMLLQSRIRVKKVQIHCRNVNENLHYPWNRDVHTELMCIFFTCKRWHKFYLAVQAHFKGAKLCLPLQLTTFFVINFRNFVWSSHHHTWDISIHDECGEKTNFSIWIQTGPEEQITNFRPFILIPDIQFGHNFGWIPMSKSVSLGSFFFLDCTRDEDKSEKVKWKRSI